MDKKTVVLDAEGVLVGKRNYPQGTDVARIPATDAQLRAWKRFGQIGEEPEPDAPSASAHDAAAAAAAKAAKIK